MAHRGLLYDGRTSARQPVTVRLVAPANLVVEALGQVSRFSLDAVTVSPQLGTQPATIDLPDGARVEIEHAAEFYADLAQQGGRRQWVHALESRWSWVLLAVGLICGFLWFAYAVGIPFVARAAAKAIPVELDQQIGAESLAILDARIVGPTQLSLKKQAEWQSVFGEVRAAVGAGLEYQLVFRTGGKVGANALALPSGIIVITDELIALAEDAQEVSGILAHEVGHIRERHSLRMLLQNSIAAGGLFLLTGDIGAVGGIAAGVPTVLAAAGYSREFEYEADAVALEYFRVTNTSPQRYVEIMTRLEEQEAGAGMPGMLSTHPSTADRLNQFRTGSD